MGNPPGAAVATPPPAAAVPAAPDFAAGIEKTVNDFDAKAAAQQAKSDAEMAPLEASARQAAQALDTKANSPVETLPLPKNLAQHLDPKQLNEAASIWMTLGALGGLLSRQPMTAALGNMTAAMKGVHEGDAEQYDRATKEFNANFDKAMKANKALIDEKEKALKDTHLSLTARLELMRLASAKAGDQMGMVKGDFKSQMELHKARIDLYYKAEAAKREVDKHADVLRHQRETMAQSERHFQALHGPGSIAIKHGAMALTPEQNEALFGENGAVTKGRLDPNKINSRTAGIFADAELKAPGKTDFAKISSDIALGRNATFRQRALVAETLPEVMRNMVDAGKKIGFSDVRTIGKMQAWVKGELNDPDMTEYMVLRNDSLMTIAGVMRGVGMTDQAHRAEIEASAPTMSPDALDAWMRGQMKSLRPRLDKYLKLTKDEPEQPPNANGKGWMLHTDAKGNRAYVSPDGKQFEEVK